MVTDSERDEKLQEIGRNAMSCIRDMVAALECDYDRLEELRDERDDWDGTPEVPFDFEVDELAGDEEAEQRVTCGVCGRSWDDAIVTGRTPAPAGRCPFEDFHSPSKWEEANPDDAEELAELEEAAGDCDNADTARDHIMEDPLSLLFRSGWVERKEDMEPEEYELLLSTGGPATRIIGEVRNGEAHSARLQAQDWGTPWTEYITTGDDHAALMTYVQCFCFET